MMSHLFAAAAIGPAALYAAINGMAYLIKGPGGIVATILATIGYPSLATLCYLILQAVATGKGIYIEIE